MKKANIDEMVKGWFIGNFEPSLLKTNDVEVAYKSYVKDDFEEKHYHKIATEYTLITKGRVKMFDCEWEKGDIIIVEPGDATEFYALEDSETVVVKIPGANNDKYVIGDEQND